FTAVNQTTISTFPNSKKYDIANAKGENVIIFVDLSKAGATVGSQGVLQLVYFQSVYFHPNDTAPTNTTLYECADIKITAESTPPSSVNAGSKSA
ncbi:10938_t:CDS:2, partial [Racocetra fulgida]